MANVERNATLLEEEYDFVFIHDPQPVAILPFHGKGNARWIWRCHIDTSQPNPEVWEMVRGYLPEYDAAVFTMAEFVPPDFPVTRRQIIPPAIDPLSPKNMLLPHDTARQVVEWIGIRPDRPLPTQVSRFDPWKDPIGVIKAYRLVRKAIPAVQLTLVGSMSADDPEGWDVYRQVVDISGADPLVHIFTNLTSVGNIEVNAFQRISGVIVQKSICEGFGLVISEALWRGTPVVAGRAGGIPLQMADGVGGLLIDTIEECAQAIIDLLQDRPRAEELARQGRERVRSHFLLPRLLLSEVELMEELAAARPVSRTADWALKHDPVCGMAVSEVPRLAASFGGQTYGFCSAECPQRFLEEPSRYQTA